MPHDVRYWRRSVNRLRLLNPEVVISINVHGCYGELASVRLKIAVEAT